jgi:two-component system cell cycle sensor histidine kinase/response regulator CckA
LGLSVVYNIVRGTGGHVRVNSEPGRGSTFQVFLPRIAATPQPRVAEVRPSRSRTGTETILVAEDQPELRWMICQYLQGLGYAVLEATDGDDALALAGQYKGPIDVLLTDIVMPNLRGPEMAQRLAASRPEIQVIFMSGYTEGAFDLAPTEKLATANVLLQKPFELKFLHEKIREVLQTRTRR